MAVASSWVVWAGLLAGQIAAPADDLPARVRQLVRRLDDKQLERRESAEKELLELGSEVLPHLPADLERLPPEVRERLARITQTLQLRLAAHAAAASRVTLRGTYSLPAAFEELARQTGNRVVGATEPDTQLALELHDVPFWEALDTALDQSRLDVNPFGGQRQRLTVTARPPHRRPRMGAAHYNGIFRIEATRVEAVRDLRDPAVQGIRVRLAIAWEPRLTPISLVQPLRDVTARDEHDRPLAVDGIEGTRGAGVESDIAQVELELPFELPPRDTRRIALLRGKLTALVPGRDVDFEFTEPLKAENVVQRQAGVTVTLRQMRKNVDVYELALRVRYDDSYQAFESHRGWIFRNEAVLVNEAGQTIVPAGFQTTSHAANEVGLTYLFALDQPPNTMKFVYRTPASILRLPVEYELRDIELP